MQLDCSHKLHLTSRDLRRSTVLDPIITSANMFAHFIVPLSWTEEHQRRCVNVALSDGMSSRIKLQIPCWINNFPSPHHF